MLAGLAQVGYEIAADNAIFMIEKDVFGGSGWVKALAPLWRGVGGSDARQAEEDKTALTTFGEWWVRQLLPNPRQSYLLLRRWLALLARLHQSAADSENVGSMLQMGNLLHYGYIHLTPPGTPTETVPVSKHGLHRCV